MAAASRSAFRSAKWCRRAMAPACACGRPPTSRAWNSCAASITASRAWSVPRRRPRRRNRGIVEMRADGLLFTLDRWGRLILPGTLLLFFVLLTLAPLRAPYLSDALPLLPALVVFQFSLATPERLPGPLLLAMGILLDLLLGGPGAPVGVSARGFVLIRAAVVANRRYLVGVPFLFQWFGFCLLGLGFVLLVWIFTALWTWTAIDPTQAFVQYVVVVVLYPLLAPLLVRVRARAPLNVPEPSRGTARPGETTS